MNKTLARDAGMTTDTPETLRAKAQEAVAYALDDALYCNRVWAAWSEGTMSEDDFLLVGEDLEHVAAITHAALDAVGFDALLKEREALSDALRWYATQGWRMGDAVMAHNNQAVLAVMKDIAVDNGRRARDALQEQTQ